MGSILSIDLAYRRVRDFGVCLLEERKGRLINARFVDPKGDLRLEDPPLAEQCAKATFDYSRKNGVRVLLLDGPQGWKDPRGELKDSRYCERVLNTPGKTGVYPQTKPANWREFADFSVRLFELIVRSGADLVRTPVIQVPEDRILAVESYPAAAWRMLSMTPLPAGSRRKKRFLEGRAQTLQRLYRFHRVGNLTHDGLQALVAGLAGAGILAGNTARYVAVGMPPRSDDGITIEGYIICPRLEVMRSR